MTDYYHYFGIKDKQNRFTMRCKSPFGFDINTARLRLDQLFSTHGTCPAINDMTWKLWKAGKEIKQWWWVTPNKLGIIKSATPLLILDGINYKGASIYLVSLTNFRKIYVERENILPNTSKPSYTYCNYYDIDGSEFSNYFRDFYQDSVPNAFDPVNMSGVYIANNALGTAGSGVAEGTIKSWIESGNIFIDCISVDFSGIGQPSTWGKVGITWSKTASTILLSVGDYLKVVPTDDILFPIVNKTRAFGISVRTAKIYSASPPSGYTYRPLIQLVAGGVTYDYVGEMTHTASKGKYIAFFAYYSATTPAYWGCCYIPALWFLTILLQYSLLHYEIIQGNAPSKYEE